MSDAIVLVGRIGLAKLSPKKEGLSNQVYLELKLLVPMTNNLPWEKVGRQVDETCQITIEPIQLDLGTESASEKSKRSKKKDPELEPAHS
ncbi:MAG: hypothetical protein L0Y74_11415 [candidate division Zixibacteria bacterium]|nr:hypothetical protein [candidate division Zixibacteria bacterium]